MQKYQQLAKDLKVMEISFSKIIYNTQIILRRYNELNDKEKPLMIKLFQKKILHKENLKENQATTN